MTATIMIHVNIDDDAGASRGRDHYATFQSVLMSRMEKYATIGSTAPPTAASSSHHDDRTELLGLSGVPAVSARAEGKLRDIQKQMDVLYFTSITLL
jgi:hypothetical protein